MESSIYVNIEKSTLREKAFNRNEVYLQDELWKVIEKIV